MGVWARGVILHWKNVEEIGCALSSYFNITWEEKYGIIETDSRRERCKKIEEAVYEFMEIFHVGEEAEEAQKEIHEQAYRESAIKNRSNCCNSSWMRCIRRIYRMYVNLKQRLHSPA